MDVVFALDVSKSMLAEDIAPNRLEKSKQIISKIIDQLGSDRVGIIIYWQRYPLYLLQQIMLRLRCFYRIPIPI